MSVFSPDLSPVVASSLFLSPWEPSAHSASSGRELLKCGWFPRLDTIFGHAFPALNTGNNNILWSPAPAVPKVVQDVICLLCGENTHWAMFKAASTVTPGSLPGELLSQLFSSLNLGGGVFPPQHRLCMSHCWPSESFCWLNPQVSQAPSGPTLLFSMSATPPSSALPKSCWGCALSKGKCGR